MTNADIKIGTEIIGRYQTMIVTKLGEKRVYGYDKKRFEKVGKKESCSFDLEKLTNPHYNKKITILNK